jgi:hypothetical protein
MLGQSSFEGKAALEGGHAKGLVELERSHMASSRKQGRHVAGALQEGVESRS